MDLGAGMWADMYGPNESANNWYWRAAGSKQRLETSRDSAALAIESRIRSLVLSLAPLLDEESKREVVKVCQPPSNFLPRDFDNEPEP